MDGSGAQTKVMVFGTFDMLHAGHVDFFQQARMLYPNPYLVVSIARDQNVTRIKGRAPENTEVLRKQIVEACELVDEAVLGAEENYIAHILNIAPHAIALGYDQVAYTEGLAEKLQQAGLMCDVIRLSAYHPEVYKTSLLSQLHVNV